MQTDPNPANFMYMRSSNRLGLLDFGAGRDFDNKFLKDYIEIIHGSYTSDKEKILFYSKKMGFLTGEEN
jgi:aarF domain-containing kinase